MTTPGQTVGPFFSHALPWPDGPYVVPAGTPGGFWLRGRVLDGAGEPVPDALVESWQADADIRGFGRSATDPDGRWALYTVRPNGPAPHLALIVFARGLLHRLLTRVYLDGDATDAVLDAIDENRRGTLVARRADDGYVFDIVLQGEHETVFFDA